MKCINNSNVIDEECLFKVLANREKAKDDELPDTGVGIEWERHLSPLFIKTQKYGTRTSTLILLNNHHELLFHERTYEGDMTKDQSFKLILPKKGG